MLILKKEVIEVRRLSMDHRAYRDALGQFATGITIVTTEYKQGVLGMTVNAFMSISLEPKMIAVSIDERASLYHTLQETKKFGVSILSESQKDISMMYAKQKEKEKDIRFTTQDDIPVLDDAIATFSCHVNNMVKAGDHIILIADVTDFKIRKQEDPILYYRGAYRTIKPQK